MRLRRPLLALLLLSGLMLGTADRPRAETAAAPAPHKIRIVFGEDGFYYIIHYVAQDGGFYAQEGLTIDPVLVAGGSKLIASVLGGSADATFVNISLVAQADSHGATLVSLASIYDAFPHSLVLSNDALKKSGIDPAMPIDEKVKRLRGLKLGVTSPGSGSDALLRTLLLTRGMSPDNDIFLQPLGSGDSMLAAFEGKLVDGFAFNPPWPEEMVAKGLGQVVINPFSGEAKELQGGTFLVLASSKATVASKAPALLALTRAVTRAIKSANDDPEKARRMVRSHFPNVDQAVFDVSFDKAIKGIPKTPVISPMQFKATLDTMNITAKPTVKVTYEQTVMPDMAQASADALLGQ